MDDLDLLHDPDDAVTAPMPPVTGYPAGATGPASPGAHRHDGPDRPWAWLVAVVAAALIAVAGLVWMIGSAVGGGGEQQPVTAPVPSASTSLSLSEPPTEPVDTAPATVPTPSSVPTVTIPPAPSATRLVPTRTPTPSATPQFVRVPDVVGDRVRNATRSLQNAGFTVSVVGIGDNQDNRRVAAQSPGGGARVRYGSTIVLLVGGR